MKKLVLILASVLLLSCSSDDNDNGCACEEATVIEVRPLNQFRVQSDCRPNSNGAYMAPEWYRTVQLGECFSITELNTFYRIF